ncbi:ATP-binding protein [Nocardioides mangrovi]|uniref:ATP-binding protein n=1 Tax=Nocardioides mangrovi TaxID=2874580 RepID=A0ABS7UE47_9ACTN|nr:ATP-binding protein [Nocardioides mangrovi]MBZ5739162.1 ATP-binding protein [Nocardioides mangrovi]
MTDGWGAVSRTATLDAAELSAQAARDVLRDTCAVAHVPTESTETALLLTSELVTNAVLHAGGNPVLDIDVQPARLRVTVTDGGAPLPDQPDAPVTPAPLAESGRGLFLVETLADRWGSEPRSPYGKAVWFELGPGPG